MRRRRRSGCVREVGPVTYLLPLPTHTRLTELELEEEEKESGRGRASQIGTLEAKVSGRQCQTVVRSSFLLCMCRDWRDNAAEQSYNYKEAMPQSLHSHSLVTGLFYRKK